MTKYVMTDMVQKELSKYCIPQREMPIISKCFSGTSPISEISLIDGKLKWVINTNNRVGERIISISEHGIDRYLTKMCFVKALTDHIAKIDNLTWSESSKIFEYVMADEEN